MARLLAMTRLLAMQRAECRTSLRQRRYAHNSLPAPTVFRPASLRQRRYVLQPRVAAQRLPWDNGSIEQFNPERVASFTIECRNPVGVE
jgi:hypothetical protein